MKETPLSIVGESTALLRILARRGLGAAIVTVDAGLHPRRTARQGARLVQDVAAFVGVSSGPAATVTDAPARGGSTTPPTRTSTAPAEDRAPEAPTPPAGPDLVVAEPAAPEPVEQADESLPVEPSGPAPHLPPDIAAEVERDYADDLPGFAGGDAELPE